MSFLVLLITLGCYKFMGARVSRDYDRWFFLLRDILDRLIPLRPLAMAITLLVPIMGLHALLVWTEYWALGLVAVLINVLALLYAFGRDNLVNCVLTYLQHWREGDAQSAYHLATDHFWLERDMDVDDTCSLHRQMRAGLLYQWFEQVFMIVFWFLVAGPVVAVFIRLMCLYSQGKEGKIVDSLVFIRHLLEWIPARLLGITFALAGNFTVCFKSWTHAIASWSLPTQDVLHQSGLAALGVCSIDPEPGAVMEITPQEGDCEACAEEITTIQDLMVRSLVVWVVVLALLAISSVATPA